MVIFKDIPQELAALDQWVLWRRQRRCDETIAKIPYSIRVRYASVSDSMTWAGFEETKAAYIAGGFDGIGFVFTDEDDFVGIDLDGCRDPQSGKIADWAAKLVAEFDTYTEISPSGSGLKMFSTGIMLGRGRRFAISEPSLGGKRAGVEIYDHGRYFAVTGHIFDGRNKIRDSQVAIDRMAPPLAGVEIL